MSDATARKSPVWREKPGEFPYFEPSWYARVAGWNITVREHRTGWGFDRAHTGRFYFHAHRGGEVQNYSDYRSLGAAQRAAENFARGRTQE
jgi:hypothetical protein